MKARTQILVLAVLTSLVSLIYIVHPAAAATNPSTARIERVAAHLSAPNFTPTRFELEYLDSDVVASLTRLARRGSTSLRARAIQSLAMFPEDRRAVESIDRAFATTRPGKKLFAPVIISFAQVHGEASVRELRRFVRHRNPGVRMASVVAIGRYGGQTGFDLLRDRLFDERDDKVRSRIAFYVR